MKNFLSLFFALVAGGLLTYLGYPLLGGLLMGLVFAYRVAPLASTFFKLNPLSSENYENFKSPHKES
jgi:hypothetical protein